MKSEFFKGMAVGILATVAVAGAGYLGYHHGLYGQGTVLSDSQHIQKVNYLEKLIDEYYLNEKDENMLAEGMYAGLIAGLGDVYSRYYTEEQYKTESEETAGEYVGIGILMEKNPEGGVKVYSCYPKSPAEAAGVETGDIITKIDDVDISDMSLTEVSDLIRVEENTSVILTIQRKDVDEALELKVNIDAVQMPVISHEMLDQKFGYIKIEEFTRSSYDQFKDAYAELNREGMEGLVIDLRNNPGGLMDTVCDILRELLPEGLIVYTEDKHGKRDEIYGEGKHPIEIPLAILVNRSSASASEIFAGAIQDYGVGKIIGTNTFGKGVVQSLISLKDGSAVKLTVSNYYTPKGHSIQKVGIKPDIEVELDERLLNKTEYSYKEDNQLQEALKSLKQ